MKKKTLFILAILITLVIVGVIITMNLLNQIEDLGNMVDDLETEVIMLNN